MDQIQTASIRLNTVKKIPVQNEEEKQEDDAKPQVENGESQIMQIQQ